MKFIIMSLLVIVLIVGCNTPAQDQQDTQNAPEENTQEEVQEETEEAKEEPTQEAKELTKTEQNIELAKIMAKSFNLKYKVTYEMTSTTNGQTMSGEMTQYVDLPDKFRTDTTAQGTESRSYLIDDKFTICTKQETWLCFENEFEKSASDMVSEDLKDNPEDYQVSKLPSKTVAGVSTDCFRVVVEGGNVDYCYSKDAIPLYIKTVTDTSQAELIASSFSKSVTNADFEPPEAQNMDDLLGDLDLPSMG